MKIRFDSSTRQQPYSSEQRTHTVTRRTHATDKDTARKPSGQDMESRGVTVGVLRKRQKACARRTAPWAAPKAYAAYTTHTILYTKESMAEFVSINSIIP